jgi:hypothetical protein
MTLSLQTGALPLGPFNVAGVRILLTGMLSSCTWCVRVGAVAPTAPDQRAALVDLYIATNGSGWSDRTGWQNYSSGSDPCDDAWSGVMCSGSGGSANRNM